MMNADQLQDIINAAGYEWRTYSGRAEYGAECIGFTVEDNDLLGAIGELMMEAITNDDSLETAEAMLKLLHRANTDSMGRSSTIVYFPSVKVTEPTRHPVP